MLEMYREPMVEQPILAVYGKCQVGSMMLSHQYWAQYIISGPQATIIKSASEYLVRNIHSSGLLEVILQGDANAHPVLSCTQKQITVLMMGQGPNSPPVCNKLSQNNCLSPGITCSLDCLQRYNNVSANVGIDVPF